MKKKGLILFLILIILIAGAFLAVKMWKKTGQDIQETNTEPVENKVEEVKQVEIFSGTERPIAIMIDNVGDAVPQAGLNDAYLVYEIIVEGQQTRMMALFKGANTDSIGPVRSSRHYFLDYALENDAIYVHFGWSPQAQSDIKSLSVNNINGQYYDSGRSRTDTAKFWRITTKSAPHNAFTNIANIKAIAENLGYRTTSNKESVLNYVTDEVNLENGENATKINIPYSSFYDVTYTYDEETKRYERAQDGTTIKDFETKEIVTTKNIIITFIENYGLNDGSGKGRQGIENIGDAEGYYITNGKVIPITCSKTSREAQTVYKDLNGNEIKVNDGNTFIQIVPINANVTIE